MANQAANNQFKLQEAENKLRMMGMNDAAIQAALQSMLQLDQLNMQGSQFGDQLAASQRNAGGMFGSLMDMGGQLGMAYATGGLSAAGGGGGGPSYGGVGYYNAGGQRLGPDGRPL